MKILVLNSGSSSQKSCLYEVNALPSGPPPEPVWAGKMEWERDDAARVHVRNSSGARIDQQVRIDSRAHATEQLLETLWRGDAHVLSSPSEIDIVGHRIVHGGETFQAPTFLTPEAKRALLKMASFAPLHNRTELEGVDVVETMIGSVPQIGVFDTAFHSHMPDSAAVYPVPFEWTTKGIRRYGFHGINHEYCAERAAQLLGRNLDSLKLVTCHLGNGCSLAAIQNGRSVDTTMGFTPLEGLMMGTRSGSIDPAIFTFLLRERKFTAEELDKALNADSGLLGVSGLSGDMRKILAARKEGHARATLAFEMFVRSLRFHIGAMTAILGGLDVLVFTGGIGENSPEVRMETRRNLEFFGTRLDGARNAASAPDGEISHQDSRVRVLVIQAQEDWAIARECWKLASASGAAHQHDDGPGLH